MSNPDMFGNEKMSRYALATRATLEKIAEDFRGENKKLRAALEMKRVYIVLAIRDFSLSQEVKPDKVFSVRSEAVKYAKEKEAKATCKWYKVIGREFIK